MTAQSTDGRTLAAITAILSLPFAIATQVLFGLVSGGEIAFYFDGARMLNLSPAHAEIYQLALWSDILGYYLIYLPLIAYAWRTFRSVDPALVDFLSLSGVIYCLLGAFAAAGMAGAFEGLYAHHNTITSAQPNGAEAAWAATIGGGFRGLWLLEAVLAALWLGGLARIFACTGRRILGLGAAALAAIWLVQFTTWLMDAADISNVALAVVVALTPIWAFCLGLSLLRAGDK